MAYSPSDCFHNWGTMNAVSIWSESTVKHPNIFNAPSYNPVWHFLGQNSFHFGFSLSFPSGSWGYGSGTGDGSGTSGSTGNTNVQYEDIHVLNKAKASIKATYGLDLDINTLIHLFGIDCILELGNRNFPPTPGPGQFYSESECVEAVLANNPIICLMSDVTTFKDKYHVEPPVGAALKCYSEFPGCTSYVAYEECVLNTILTSNYKENYLNTAQYQTNLGLIRDAVISGKISIETAEKIFDATLRFGATASHTNYLINLAQQGGSINFLTILVDNFGYIEPQSPPVNPPITSTRRVCKDVFKFVNGTNTETNTPLAAATLTDIHFAFTFNNNTIPLTMGNLCILVNQNDGVSTCLPKSDLISGDAINAAVSMTQSYAATIPTGTPVATVSNMLKDNLYLNLVAQFKQQFVDCNINYTAVIDVPVSDLHFNALYNVTATNCDIQIVTCP